ncbi:MAG: hypothetical protein ACRC18_07020 [Cetobacterium sp.]
MLKNVNFTHEIEVNALNGCLYNASCGEYKELLINKYVKDMSNTTFTIYTFENEKGYIKRNTKLYKSIKEEILSMYPGCIVNDYTLKEIRGIEILKIK